MRRRYHSPARPVSRCRDNAIGVQTEARQTGLGSRLTKALIAQLRGEIEVSSNMPGTRVTLRVPYSAHTDMP